MTRSSDIRMESLASKMFGDVTRGIQDLGKAIGIQGTTEGPKINKEAGADDVVSDIDARAQRGEITFEDFIVSARK